MLLTTKIIMKINEIKANQKLVRKIEEEAKWGTKYTEIIKQYFEKPKSNFENIMKDIRKSEKIIDEMRLKELDSMFKFKLADYDNNKLTYCFTKKEFLKEFKKIIKEKEGQIVVGVTTDIK